MSFQQKLKHEIKTMGIAMIYFGSWIAALMLLKSLVLSEYSRIETMEIARDPFFRVRQS